MSIRSIVVCVAAAGLAAGQAAAQDPTQQGGRRTQRVQISKGEVALPRVDTVVVTRIDTVYVHRTDSVYFPGRRVVHVPYEVARIDTVRVSEGPPPFVRTPLYAALYTGMTAPAGSVDRLYVNGFHAGAMLGWDAVQEPVGIRIKGDAAMLSREPGSASAIVGSTTPTIVNVGADLKVYPLMQSGWRIYGVGGGLVSMYKGLATVSDRGPATLGGETYQPATASRWQTKLGWNLGGGADVQFGHQELFFEARAVAIQAHGAQTWFVPISLGIRFF